MMPKKVPYLKEKQIEFDASVLLTEYEQARGVKIERAVPIDDIVEKHLKLGIEFDDMHRLLNHPRSGSSSTPDILAAIFFEKRRVVVDESLDPEENPNKEGRYRFTLAHESGHWQMHRLLFDTDPAQDSLINGPVTPSVVCRSSQKKNSLEWQADFYASCLLMPRDLVTEAWDEMFPDRKPRVLQPLVPIDHPFVEMARFECRMPGIEFTETDDQALERIARPLADQFLVSAIAMRIRLETIGLLYGAPPHQRIISGGA